MAINAGEMQVVNAKGLQLPRRAGHGDATGADGGMVLPVGEPITRLSRIVSIQEKQGRSGPLVFVVVRHEVSSPVGLALTEKFTAAPGIDNP